MSRSPEQIGAFWDEKYRVNPQGYGVRPNAFLESVANRIPAGSHLYVPGDGYGRNGLWLARRGYRITLADLSTVGIEAANRRAAEENLDLTATVADVSSFDPGEIDAAVLIYLHLAPEPRQRFHALVQNSLKPGALLLLEAFSLRQRALGRTSGGPGDPMMLYSTELLRKEFSRLSFEVLEERTLPLDEGIFHSGEAEVVRAVAVKR